jgi:tRNA threonylcarbamoyladenosine biosynthesis protein TsaB
MSLILNIDTASDLASISLTKNGEMLSMDSNTNNRDHASWIHPAIKNIFKQTSHQLQSLNAIAVSQGPGSYTGLRIGLSTAKGLCYALNIPLITIPTLELLTRATVELIPQNEIKSYDLLVPMIDARRLEAYSAVYDTFERLVTAPSPIILDPTSFTKLLTEKKCLFFGNGSRKFRDLTSNRNAFFKEFAFIGALHMNKKSLQYYDNGLFADLTLSEPLYIKEFYDTKR